MREGGRGKRGGEGEGKVQEGRRRETEKGGREEEERERWEMHLHTRLLNTFSVFLSESVQDVHGVKASVVTELARDDLQRPRHGCDDELLLPCHCLGVVS